MFPKKDKFDCTAKTVAGLEEVLANELKALGAQNITPGIRNVKFTADKELVYKGNISLRTCLKILVPIKTFTARNEHDLYRLVRDVDWSEYMDDFQTIAIDAAVSGDYFDHSQYVTYKVKDAIVDQFRDKSGKRPSVDLDRPDLRINVHINKDQITLSLDSSGDSLHKRGYRVGRHMAPLNEVLAAGLVLLSGWDGKSEFCDPMCGSGTIPIEAGLYAYNMAPNGHRTQFGFSTWKDYDFELLDKIKAEAKANEIAFDGEIWGSDKTEQAVRSAKENVVSAGLGGKVEISRERFQYSSPITENGVMIINPPYGERLVEADILELYSLVGDTLKQHYTGFDAWILSSNKEAMKNIGLKTSKKLTLYNGQLECKFHGFSLYKGTKK